MEDLRRRWSVIDTSKRLHRNYPLPTILMFFATLCLLVSLFLPYWRMDLEAPQYPDGLWVQIHVNKVIGDVEEIDGLNHYIGMAPLDRAATLERTLGVFAVATMALGLIATIFIHNRWAAMFAIPVILFPVLFLADLFFWLRLFGQDLDPSAALSSTVEPFMQPLFGTKVIANFVSTASFGSGFFLACLAALLTLLGLYVHWKTYKPLYTRARDAQRDRIASLINVDPEVLAKAIAEVEEDSP